MAVVSRDRRAKLKDQDVLNGIDFVEILDDTETRLRVHFLRDKPGRAALEPSVTDVTITGGESIVEVAVTRRTWDEVDGQPILDLEVAAPGDFSTYTLTVTSNLLDGYFRSVPMSFKARCPSTLDCEALPPEPCEPPPARVPAIDYRAKDFDSFKRALLEFSSRWYPAWQERSEADFGVMFLEALAGLADDLSYLQDRIAAEAWLETASERRSLVRMARLVDYEPRVATAAATDLQFAVRPGNAFIMRAGVQVSGHQADGELITFETGTGLDDGGSYNVDARWNEMPAYWLDDRDVVLHCGATSIYVVGSFRDLKGQRVVIDTTADPEADPPIREIVTITDATEFLDPLFAVQTTLLTWDASQALTRDHDLRRTVVRGNVVPATHGVRHSERFITSEEWDLRPPLLHDPPRALVRTGPNDTLQFLYTLGDAPLAWLPKGKVTKPELKLVEVGRDEWDYHRWLLDADPYDGAFTIDPARYIAVDTEPGFAEYDGAAGETLRFGDGTFGPIPAEGAVFEVTYRVGGGSRGNVAADALDRIEPSDPVAGMITSVNNPLAATGGTDAETDDHIRMAAPEAFRSRTYRAVRAEDYSRAATQELDWVQRAGTQFRWTGSWLSVFTAIDPRGVTSVSTSNLVELDRVLDRYRMAGYEAFGTQPRYANLDVAITVCARPDVFRSDVERAIVAALDSRTGYFAPDHFTFGTPLERSTLEATVQNVVGVDGVVEIRYRRRGWTNGFEPMADTVEVAGDEIVRVDNDPNRPGAGSLSIDVLGGR